MKDYRVHYQYKCNSLKNSLVSLDVENKNERYILYGSSNGIIAVFDSFSLDSVFEQKYTGYPSINDVSWMKYDNGIFSFSSNTGDICFVSSRSPEKILKHVKCDYVVHSIGFNYLNPVLIATQDNGRARIIDIREAISLLSINTNRNHSVISNSWSTTNENLLVIGDSAGFMYLFDTRNPNKYIYEFDWWKSSLDSPNMNQPSNESSIINIFFNKSGRELYSVSQYGVVRGWSPDSGLSIMKEYRTETLKEETRIKCSFIDGYIALPKHNSIYWPELDITIAGHLKSVRYILPTYEGFVSLGNDNILNIWNKSDQIVQHEDFSDWSD